MINIGDMNKKIEIYGFGFEKDDLGQEIRKEKMIARVWAKVRLARSTESIKILKNEATEEMQFTIRYRKGLDKTMKIKYRDKMYCINSIENEEEADRFLILHAEAVEEDEDTSATDVQGLT